MHKALVLPLVGVMAVVAGCGSTASTGKAIKPGPINIGVIAPFSGPAAEFGTLISAPCYAAGDLINQAGGFWGTRCSAPRWMTRVTPLTRCPT